MSARVYWNQRNPGAHRAPYVAQPSIMQTMGHPLLLSVTVHWGYGAACCNIGASLLGGTNAGSIRSASRKAQSFHSVAIDVAVPESLRPAQLDSIPERPKF
jgi:hypothetical protein